MKLNDKWLISLLTVSLPVIYEPKLKIMRTAGIGGDLDKVIQHLRGEEEDLKGSRTNPIEVLAVGNRSGRSGTQDPNQLKNENCY